VAFGAYARSEAKAEERKSAPKPDGRKLRRKLAKP